jgi:UDP-N-acetyl-D-glucosamine dehydrogenase
MNGETIHQVARRHLRQRKTSVGIIGLGYVGLPLALAFSKLFYVYGFDANSGLVDRIRQRAASVNGANPKQLRQALRSHFKPTKDFSLVERCDFVIVAVGTPLGPNKEPDLTQVKNAGVTIARHLRRGQFVILESTSYPGTTEEILIPILEKSGLRAGIDFGVGYSPERVDPGNVKFKIEDIPKLVGGLDEDTAALISELYGNVFSSVVTVSSMKVAEAAKIIENVFRAVNIALANEIALIMERLGIDAWDAIDAASTKPFGYMPFYPGPGVGGHCIPLDPHYLAYRARKEGYMARFIELSADVNSFMPFHTVELLRQGLAEVGKELSGSTVAVLGVAFKRNVGDTRESPAGRVIEECALEGVRLRVFDPLASSISTRAGTFKSTRTVASALRNSDAAVILADHDQFRQYDYDQLTKQMRATPVWVDTRNVLRKTPHGSVCMGIGRPAGRVP